MITSFELVNFRCFKSASVEKCTRINLIVGRNASGKTTLLEGIFLALSSTPEPIVRIRQWRGFDPALLQGSQKVIQRALWGDLFNDWQKAIRLEANGGDQHVRKLTIDKIKSEEFISFGPKNLPQGRSSGIVFKYKAKGQEDTEIVPSLSQNGVVFPMVDEAPTEVLLFAANQTSSSAESASRLSQLSKLSTKDDLVKTFMARYPRVEDLTVELLAGSPLVYAKLKGEEQRIPLTLVSGGMNRLAAILLGISNCPRSVVLIDEIENGLYYKDLPEIWNSLLTFATAYDVQIFASTHSGECLTAAAELAKKNPESFSVIQASDGKLHQFEGDKFVWAVEEDFEIR